tara:strand:+ start:271 stop:687 length:417 start_codon:yes stop_codon:yes gene_type:complete
LKNLKENRKFSIKDILGEGVSIKETRKSVIKKDRDFFTNLVTALVEIDSRTETLIELGVDLITYEDPYHTIIEGLIFKHYGPIKGEIIMWWLSEKRLPERKNMTLLGNDGVDYPINTPIQLYQSLKKVDKLIKENDGL